MKQHENIKYQSRLNRDKKVVKNSNIFKFLFVTLIFAFLFLNLVYSQLLSPLYFQLVSNNKKATVNFLEKIKTFPEFQKILEMNKNIYGKTVEEETFQQENDKKLVINNLEQKLRINPKARDVLYSLYQLYLSEGDKNRASDYLRRAREVDPLVK